MKNSTPATENNAAEIEIIARAKAFTGQPIQSHKFLVRGHNVTVWDCVAGHFTECNSLGAVAKKRIANLARSKA